MSIDNLLSELGTNLDKIPVILNSTFFVISPFSYPKILSSNLILSSDSIGLLIPEQFKNWFIVLSVYWILVLIPDIIVPLVSKPTVESTVITVEFTGTSPITFVLPGILKVPVTYSSSS